MSDLCLVERSSLVKKYGHLVHLLRMSYEQICRYKDITDEEIFAIIKMQNEVRESYRLDLMEREVSVYNEIFQNYCFLRLQKRKREVLLVFFLDEKNHLIIDELVHIGISNKVAFFSQDVNSRARKHNASALIVAHNHPSGNPLPSSADIKASRLFFTIAEGLGIKCIASLIVGGESMLKICPENVENLTKII